MPHQIILSLGNIMLNPILKNRTEGLQWIEISSYRTMSDFSNTSLKFRVLQKSLQQQK